MLDDEAGVALLDEALRAARPSDDRIHADRQGAARLAGICGGLPLALQITAALLKADPSRTVSEMADELTDEMQRLEMLRYDDGSGTSAPSVAAAFELSYRHLDMATARVFRLMPVNPGPDVSTAAVAALADLPVGDVRKVISQLVRAHLIEAAAGAAGRWRMHDLLRISRANLSRRAITAGNRAADPGVRDDQERHRLVRWWYMRRPHAGAGGEAGRAVPIACSDAFHVGRDQRVLMLLVADGHTERAARRPLSWRRRPAMIGM